MNPKIVLAFVLLLSSLTQARSLRLDALGRILSIRDTDYEANLYDWMNSPLGLVIDHTYPYRQLGLSTSWEDGEFRRIYDPESVSSTMMQFDQRSVFSGGRRVFSGSVSFQRQWQRQVYRSLILHPYDQPFKLLDYSTGNINDDQMKLDLAYTQYIWRNLALAPQIEYTLENSLKKTFVKADNVIRRNLYGLGLGWVTPSHQWYLAYRTGDGKNRMTGPKDKSSPVVLLQVGENMIKIKSTSSTYNFVREMDRQQISAGWIKRFGPAWYSSLDLRYEMEKSTFIDGSTTKDYWGFFQEEDWQAVYTLRLFPSGCVHSWAMELGFHRQDGWSKSHSYNYLYQEFTLDALSAKLAFTHEIYPVVFSLHHQLGVTILKNDYQDYMGAYYIDNTGSIISIKNSGEYLLNESFHLMGMVELESVKNDIRTEYVDYYSIMVRGGLQKDFRQNILEISAGIGNRFHSSRHRTLMELIFNFKFY
ncbi:MAG: hypothetical protein KBA26_01635 [Candidatus Delongbacteria bacterium]|nr:hypothetical protein [Candidatus Delongbacteria bacterium]